MQLEADAAQSVEALLAARPKRAFDARVRASHPMHIPRRLGRLSSGERRRLRRGIDLHWPPPPEVEPGKALIEVLRTDDVYDLHRGTPLGERHPDRLKLSRRPMTPKPISKFLDTEARRHLEQWQKYIVRSSTEMLELADSGTPLKLYWDRTLRSDKAAMRAFLKILHKSGMLAGDEGRERRSAPSSCSRRTGSRSGL